MPNENVALSPADGRLMLKIRRIVVMVRCHGPPAIERPATPRQRITNIAVIPRNHVIACAHADPIGPIPSTSMKMYASATLSTTPALVSHIGVRVSPAARIADVPMSHTVEAPLLTPITWRNGAPI